MSLKLFLVEYANIDAIGVASRPAHRHRAERNQAARDLLPRKYLKGIAETSSLRRFSSTILRHSLLMAAALHLIEAFICRRVTPGFRATRFSISRVLSDSLPHTPTQL